MEEVLLRGVLEAFDAGHDRIVGLYRIDAIGDAVARMPRKAAAADEPHPPVAVKGRREPIVEGGDAGARLDRVGEGDRGLAVEFAAGDLRHHEIVLARRRQRCVVGADDDLEPFGLEHAAHDMRTLLGLMGLVARPTQPKHVSRWLPSQSRIPDPLPTGVIPAKAGIHPSR